MHLLGDSLSDEIVRIGQISGALATIGVVSAVLYRRAGVRTAVRWLTRHIREDRAVERIAEFRAALGDPALKAERRAEIEGVIEVTVAPAIDRISTRIDDHMDTEEAHLGSVSESLVSLNEKVTSHLTHDDLRFAEQHDAHLEGQRELADALDGVKGELEELKQAVSSTG